MKHQTQINLDVDITYEILDALRVEDQVLPPMLELVSAYVSLEKPDGKVSRVNLLKVLSESQRMLLEDEITEELVQP